MVKKNNKILMHKIIISFKEEIMKTLYFLNKITTTVFFLFS